MNWKCCHDLNKFRTKLNFDTIEDYKETMKSVNLMCSNVCNGI